MFISNGSRLLKIGLIGAGRIVENIHLPVLTTLPNVKVSAIYDPRYQNTVQLATRFGSPVVCQSRNALFEQDLDAVLIACPNAKHAEMSIAALNAGLDVICEKPMATSYADAYRMVQTAERTEKTLLIALPNRFHSGVAALHEAVVEGWLGKIETLRCGWLRQQGIPGGGTWFTSKAQSGGGALIDLGSHLLDLAVWLGSNPQLEQAISILDLRVPQSADAVWYGGNDLRTHHPFDVEIAAEGFLRSCNRLSITIETCWGSNYSTGPHLYSCSWK